MSLFRKINYIFNKKQKIKLIILLLLILVASVLELIGVSAILPLVDVAMNPEIISENKYYVLIAEVFRLRNINDFILFFSLSLIILYIVKNTYLILYRNYQYTFTYDTNRLLSLKLMNSYLRQDYLFHVSHNVAELQRNISSDVESVYGAVIKNEEYQDVTLEQIKKYYKEEQSKSALKARYYDIRLLCFSYIVKKEESQCSEK